MTDSDELPMEYPVLVTLLVAAVGALGYVVPTAIFGNPVDPTSTALFAGAFAVVYMGIAFLRQRYPELQEL